MPLSQRIPTVTIVGQNGEPLRINESDFDPDKHKLMDASEPVVETTPIAEPAPATSVDLNKLGVKKYRGKFWVADGDNKKLSGTVEGIDTENGYETEQSAWDAILALA